MDLTASLANEFSMDYQDRYAAALGNCGIAPFTTGIVSLFGCFYRNFSRTTKIECQLPVGFTNDEFCTLIGNYFEIGFEEAVVGSAFVHISMQNDWINATGKDYYYRITSNQFALYRSESVVKGVFVMKPAYVQRLQEDAKLYYQILTMTLGVQQSIAQLLANQFKDDIIVDFDKAILVNDRFTEVLPTAILIAREKLATPPPPPLPCRLGHRQARLQPPRLQPSRLPPPPRWSEAANRCSRGHLDLMEGRAKQLRRRSFTIRRWTEITRSRASIARLRKRIGIRKAIQRLTVGKY